MKTPEITNIENQTQDNKPEKKGFPQDTKELFSKLNKSEGISEEFFISQIDRFKQDNKEGYKILDSMSNFFEQNNLNDTKSILAATLLIQQIQEKKGDKTERFFKLRLKRKPAKIVKMIEGFTDDVEKLSQKQQVDNQKQQVDSQKQQVDNQKQQVDNQKQQVDNQKIKKEQEYTKKSNEVNEIFIHQITEKLKSDVNEKAPEYKAKIQEKQNQLQKAGVKNPDEAYLLAFSSLRKENPDFTAKIGDLDANTQAVLKQVESKYSGLLFTEKAVGADKVQGEISDFVSSEDYNEQLKSSLNTEEFEKTQLDYQEQAKLSKMYPKLIENIFSQIASKNEKLDIAQLKQDYEQFLQTGEVKDKEKALFEKIGKLLKAKFSNTIEQNYVQNYKKTAMEAYTKSVFTLMEETLGIQGVSKESGNKDTEKGVEKGFEIGENGKIEMNFNYKGTPLSFEITPEGEIFMTNYLARKNQTPNSPEEKFSGSFELKKTKLNNFFSLVGLKDLLTPGKTDIKALLEGENPLDSLNKNIQTQIESKISQNNSLGNKELMKTETKYEMQRQVLAHNFLSLYRPPVSPDYLAGNKGEITDENRGLFDLLNRFDKTIRMNSQAEGVLDTFFSNDKITRFLENIRLENKDMTTEELFKKLGFVNQDGLNISKMKKFEKAVSKVTSKNDLNELPSIDGFRWKYNNGILGIEKEDTDSFFEAKLNAVYGGYGNIDLA